MQNNRIDGGKAFDWGRTSADYAKYRDIYPPEFYQRILDRGLCTAGQTALDLGTGTGVLPRNLYRHGANWTGVDLSENQIAQAQRLAGEQNMDIRFFAAPAEETGLPADTFDVITACQCFVYFDKRRILPEIHRLLKPGGHFLLLFMAWLPFESTIAMGSEQLVLKYNPSWTGGGMTRTPYEIPDGSDHYFTCQTDTFEAEVPFTRETWHGRIVACRGIGASSLPQEQIDAFKAEHETFLQTVPPEFTIPHYVTMLDFTAKK